MRTLRFPLILLALVGLIALAGCGGDDEESTSTEATTSTETEATTSTSTDDVSSETGEYTAQVRDIFTEFGTTFTTLGTELQGVGDDDEEAARLLGELETQMQGTIDDMRAIQPPAEAQEGHDQLIAALEAFSAKLTAVSDAAASGDATEQEAAVQEFQAAGVDFQTQTAEAVQTLSEAGIDLQGAAAPAPAG